MLRFMWAFIAMQSLWGSACCTTPFIAPAAGLSGPYVHASAPSGFVIPGSGWPPKNIVTSGGCVDERKSFETAQGVGPTPCPQLEALPLTAAGPKADGIASLDNPIPSSPGLAVLCYELGPAVLVLEFVQSGSLCTRVTGIAVFRKARR